jgi:hypothetical protein
MDEAARVHRGSWRRGSAAVRGARAVLETIPPELNRPNLDALRRGLQELGYAEGGNYILEYRSADGQAEQFPRLAAELVQSRVDLIITRCAGG